MDHFAPLLYALGAAGGEGVSEVFCDARVLGSMSMTGYLFA
jgi:4,5-DOPA dioxygenase extradiol